MPGLRAGVVPNAILDAATSGTRADKAVPSAAGSVASVELRGPGEIAPTRIDLYGISPTGVVLICATATSPCGEHCTPVGGL
ncbi:hypothetical protein [Streptomyces sp. P17]|uniref:hypothetical protein n=1 Tax=Streptomyces sp. P17 TaxID=3074716 RepID=UPI0028F417B6|nr:hypothetical protein [Streptomyces sp. P17]MDT9700465.1 hypothetical protein [Streptomyces sp. P17]